ncbi:hypothetical protein XENOCAPTIV_003804 [Xenoophorus captivus]|uniref:Uncharacterized protein n=1 Tax=Xenoophorus captivus TaxID=1517983 RepID=A0ABV0QL99_9TELE
MVICLTFVSHNFRTSSYSIALYKQYCTSPNDPPVCLLCMAPQLTSDFVATKASHCVLQHCYIYSISISSLILDLHHWMEPLCRKALQSQGCLFFCCSLIYVYIMSSRVSQLFADTLWFQGQ